MCDDDYHDPPGACETKDISKQCLQVVEADMNSWRYPILRGQGIGFTSKVEEGKGLQTRGGCLNFLHSIPR